VRIMKITRAARERYVMSVRDERTATSITNVRDVRSARVMRSMKSLEGGGGEDPDDNMQDFMEQGTHLERFADSEQTKEAHRRQSECKGEIVSAATVFIPG
jgi:hypothetical protein